MFALEFGIPRDLRAVHLTVLPKTMGNVVYPSGTVSVVAPL
ncbi:hypothetical protein [Chromohalobacter canadensis]|nr:hypothetical protein [Chromohalobacter canadensis]